LRLFGTLWDSVEPFGSYVALSRSRYDAHVYVGLNAAEIDDAVVTLGSALAKRIPALHSKFELKRRLTTDMYAVELLTKQRVA
jgi:hypothetical protein